MHDLETIKRLNYENPKQERELIPIGNTVHSHNTFKEPSCPYCYDGVIVNKDGELECSACHKQVIINEV